jgi:hypothetical protein
MCSSKRSPKRQFGQETRPKWRALGKTLIHVQTLDLGKGPVENVLSFPNPKFSLDKENPHRWRCSKSITTAQPKASLCSKILGHVLSRDRPFQIMAFVFGGIPAPPHPFVVPYTSGGVPKYGGKFLLRFGNRVVLCNKKMVRVHEWKRLADRVAGAAQNSLEIGEFARGIANCRKCTNKVFFFGRASLRLRLDSCHDLMKVTAPGRNFPPLRQTSSSRSS